MRRKIAIGLQLLIVVAFGYQFWINQAVYGLALTDDGEVLGMAWRVSNGQLPHTDFYSIRPAGFSYIHAPFTRLETGMLAYDRLFVVFQFCATAYFTLAALLQKQRVVNGLTAILTVTAFMLNVNSWPILAWHTIDGLFLASFVLFLASRSSLQSKYSTYIFAITWFIAGATVLMKQGYLLFLAILAGYYFAIGLRRAIFFIPFSTIPIGAYLWLSKEASPSTLTQISIGSSSPIEFLIPLGVFLFEFKEPVFVVFFILTLLSTSMSIKGLKSKENHSRAFCLFRTLLPFALILVMGILQDFSMSDGWIHIAIINATLMLFFFRDSKKDIWIGIAMLSLAYLISISRGVPSPSLLVGTFLVAAFSKSIFIYSRNCQPLKSYVVLLISAIFFLLTFFTTNAARSNFVYQEAPRDLLKYQVPIDTLKHIRMSERSAKYLTVISECISKYPASRTAILPDGPGIYPIFKLQNPFPNDWFYNLELDPTGKGEGMIIHERNIREVVSELNQSNSWLVLNQPRPFSDYTAKNVYDSGKNFYYSNIDSIIFSELQGIPVKCGSLTGLYKP